GWGYSYMDHTGGYYMVMAILMAMIHKQRTGEGQWVDMATTESAQCLHGPALLDWTVNKRPTRQASPASSNRNIWPAMAPHGIYPCQGEDEWLAISCRDEDDWQSFVTLVDESWCQESVYLTLASRLEHQDALDQQVALWTAKGQKFALADELTQAGIPASAVNKPEERIDLDSSTGNFGLWPTIHHTKMGDVRVDGQPVHFSETNWQMRNGAPCLGEHTQQVLTNLLGYSIDEVEQLRQEGVV
ncbi:MAG: CoA transferase, partial [Pseudomonadales bacterium]|nr:CoA transferase [Pseudomonadales bacterium]